MMQKLGWLMIATALLAVRPAVGATFFDSTGDNFDGNANLDISSVDVSDDGTNITFQINLTGDIAASNWGKYMIGIDTSSATGDPNSPVGNPWGRNITMADKMDAWIGCWVDSGGGFQPWTYSGGSWTQNGTGSPVLTTNSTTITTSLASLGLTAGQSFKFDVYSGGGNGGDSANDSAANPNQSTNNWGGPYTTPASGVGEGLSYTTVPEPATAACLGLALLAAAGTVRRRK